MLPKRNPAPAKISFSCERADTVCTVIGEKPCRGKKSPREALPMARVVPSPPSVLFRGKNGDSKRQKFAKRGTTTRGDPFIKSMHVWFIVAFFLGESTLNLTGTPHTPPRNSCQAPSPPSPFLVCPVQDASYTDGCGHPSLSSAAIFCGCAAPPPPLYPHHCRMLPFRTRTLRSPCRSG